MAATSALLEYLVDQLAPLGDVRGRRMFSGHGLFLGEIMFAIIAEETLYLKADADNRADFERESMAPFTYASRGRRIALSYWEAPASVIEEPDELQRWVRQALAAARRNRAAKPAGGKKPRRRSSP